MEDPFLMDWLFNKDNPPYDKDNPSNVKMSSHSNPKTGSFVSTLATDQPPFHSITTRTKNDNMIMKIAMSRAIKSGTHKEILQELEEEREWQKLEHVELLQKLSEERDIN